MQLTVQKRILGMLLLFLIGTIAMEVIHVWSERDAMISEKKLKTRHLVQTAVSIIKQYKDLEDAGQLSRADAQAGAMKIVRGMQYGNNEYFWILDAKTPVMLMHPAQPSLEGQRFDTPQFDRVTSLQPDTDARVRVTDGKANLGLAFHEIANKSGTGFITYLWPKPAMGDANAPLYPKLSYVEKFAPWDWVVGSGIYVDDVEAAIRYNTTRYITLVTVIGGLLTIIALQLANSVIRPLKQSTERLLAMSNSAESFGPLPIERNDEIGALIQGYNHLQAMLHERENSLRLAASVVENSLEAIVITDSNHHIIRVNPAFTRLTGYAADDIVGTDLDELRCQCNEAEQQEDLWQSLQEGKSWEGEWPSCCKSGRVFIARAAIVPVTGPDHRVNHYVAVLQDVTEQVRLTEQLRSQAHTDYLTGLWSRGYFFELATRELNRLDRYEGLLSIAVLDLDHFKQVNDTYGHAIGDEVLKAFSSVCRRALRDTDIVGRIGGEEFAVVFTQTDGRKACEVAERLRQAVSEAHVEVKPDLLIQFSVSIGIAERLPEEMDLDAILVRADEALYLAKHQGRNRIFLANENMTVFTPPPCAAESSKEMPHQDA